MTGSAEGGRGAGPLSSTRVRDLVCHVWGKQACQIRPSDWSEHVLPALMQSAGATQGKNATSEGNQGRQSLKPALDEAVSALVEAFGGDAPDDPVTAVWVAFPKLDPKHRTMLANLLLEERTYA
jgi:hypothetical protein